MPKIRYLSALMALLCLMGAVPSVLAAEVDCDSVYCFTPEDFDPAGALSGICITDLPEPASGTVMLGTRVLRPGDILTAQQVSQMTFSPLKTETDCSAEVGYLPIFEDSVAPHAVMTIAVRGKEDHAPVAEDLAAETYKNLPLTGKLKVSDPEGQQLTFTLTRPGKRGSVVISEDGSYTYTPKKNKVGVDSFTFTATDPAGKVSREATVTINILKPTDATQYTDTMGQECQFAAEWMRNTGIFTGEQLAGKACFGPEKEVTRGEFVTMLTRALEIPTEETDLQTLYTDEIPKWLQPYLAAAVRSGLTAGLPEQVVFGANLPITGAEAAVMLQNALDFSVPTQMTGISEDSAYPWAESALQAMAAEGIVLDGQSSLTRADTAMILYQAVQANSHTVFEA